MRKNELYFCALDPLSALPVNTVELVETNKALYKRNNALIKAISRHRKQVKNLSLGVISSIDTQLWGILDKHLTDYR